MLIRPAQPSDAAAWERMRQSLWPSSLGEHAAEFAAFFDGGLKRLAAALIAVQGKYTSSNIVFAGAWAFDRLAFTLTSTPLAGGTPVQEVAKGMHIYRRQSDGSWKIAQDIWNSDNPPDAGQ